MDTPPFLLWALEYSCPVRGLQTGADPERTERHLRAAREVSEARREGRVFEGLCVQPPNGFDIENAMAIYGGDAATEAACRGCPANALREFQANSLAGCYGLLPIEPQSTRCQLLEMQLSQPAIAARYLELFDATEPRHFGLWLNGTPELGQLPFLVELLGSIASDDPELRHFTAGLSAALSAALRVHVRFYPGGRVEGRLWKLVPHCPRCSAPWEENSPRYCRVCRYVGAQAEDKNRNARGQRPYFPLDRLLGPDRAAAFLTSYQAYRARQELLDRAQSPPRPVQPGNPQAD